MCCSNRLLVILTEVSVIRTYIKDGYGSPWYGLDIYGSLARAVSSLHPQKSPGKKKTTTPGVAYISHIPVLPV